jgi:hypothetical protein
MAVTITTTPLVGNAIYADTDTLNLTLQTVADPNWNKPYWEISNGTLSSYLAESPTFTPANISENVVINGYRAIYMQGSWTTLTNFSQTAPYGSLIKNAGVNGTWDARATSSTLGLSTYDGFYSFSTSENSTEKAGGLSENTGGTTPTDATFRYAWHLGSTGLATIRRLGVALVSNISYVANDVFKIHKIGTNVYFYKNSTLYYTYAEDVDNLFPLAVARTSGASIKNNVFYNTNSGQQGSLVVPVYAVLPEQPNWSYELTRDNVTLASVAEDGSSIFNKKGKARSSYSLQYVERPYDEYVLISDFWDAHEKHKSFAYRDVVFNKTYIVNFDTGLKLQPAGPDRISMSFVIREV